MRSPRPFSRPARLPGLVLGAIALLALLGCGGCSTDFEPIWPADGSLTVALSNAPTHLDPRVGTDAASGNAAQLLYNGLVTKDPHGNLIPDLAESWEALEGGRRWRFHLRPGVRWHDGRRFTADDVVWTYTTILDGTVTTAKRAAYANVEELVAVDEHTVDFHLDQPFAPLLADLTPAQGVVPAGSTPEAMNEHPVGTGPFRFVRRTPETLTLAAFEDHFAGAPQLERVILKEIPDVTVRALELMKGTVQLVINDLPPDLVPMFEEHPAYRVQVDPGSVYAYVGVNLEDPVLRHRRVRQALAHGIDRQRLVDTLWQGLGVVTETMLPPGLWARNEALEPYDYDPDRARRLLDEAGFPDPDGDGPEPRLRLTLKTSTSEIYVLQAQIVQQMLSEIGVAIELRSQEFATFYADVRRGAFQLFTLNRLGILDPQVYAVILHSDALPPEGQNRGRFRNARFDDLVDRGARLPDPAERRPLYLEAQEILRDELPYISLYTRMSVAVMPSRLRGYENYPSGELLSLKNIHWATASQAAQGDVP